MPDQILSIPKTEFDEFKPAVFWAGDIVEEKEWYVDPAETILGILTVDSTDKDWGYVILGRDERGQFRAFDVKVNVETEDEARELLIEKMTQIHDSGETVFPKGINPHFDLAKY